MSREPEEQITDWKAKTDAATPGPWVFSFAGHDDYEPGLYPQVLKMDNGDTIIELDAGSREVNEASSSFRYDADFIAVSRAAMPRLLAAIEAIRALHGEMRYHNPDGSVIPACSVCDSQPYPCETLQALDAALSGSEPDEGSKR